MAKKLERIYEMELHERILQEVSYVSPDGKNEKSQVNILRVASGWIYTVHGENIFIPYDNCFQV